MGIFSRSTLTILSLVICFLVQTDLVGGHSIGVHPLETKTLLREPPILASVCPNESAIFPCTCSLYQGVQIFCEYSPINETTLEIAMRELRAANGIPKDRGVDFRRFLVFQTDLTQVDLSLFYGSKIFWLDISLNGKLAKLVTSGNPGDYGSIQAQKINLWRSPSITGEIFGDTLKYFANDLLDDISIISVDLSNWNNNNNNPTDEIFPGLSSFTNLTSLHLNDCGITGRLNSSHFQNFPKLESILLASNRIDGIGENVFGAKVTTIALEANNIVETSIHVNSGLARAGRETDLYLNSNKIKSLPQKIFETFLDADSGNALDLDDNPVICDQRLSWIKARRDELQSRVYPASCSNDPSHNVFDSDLIP